VDDNVRLCEFIYRNLGLISATTPRSIPHGNANFPSVFWVNETGEHPSPATNITPKDIEQGVWKVNPAVANSITNDYPALQTHALHYAKQLSQHGKYPLTVWPTMPC